MSNRAMETPARLFHFSEDPGITAFVPHVPKTNPSQRAAVWAIDAAHAPLYWFPRDCPRGTVWARSAEERQLLAERFDTTASRLHVTERRWHGAMASATIHRYDFDPDPFVPWLDDDGGWVADGQWVAFETVVAPRPRLISGLVERHDRAGIDLRFVDSIWPFWDSVVESGLPFSGVRLANAVPRRDGTSGSGGED